MKGERERAPIAIKGLRLFVRLRLKHSDNSIKMDAGQLRDRGSRRDSTRIVPTLKCAECEGILVLHWDKESVPYVKHQVKNEVEHKIAHESWLHAFAKRLLCLFLNNGGKCIFSHRCVRTEESVESKLFYEEDISINAAYSKLDIAGTNAQGRVVVCIEIRGSNKHVNAEERKTLTWFEVDAMDVLRKLNPKVISEKIVLDNSRELSCCIGRVLTPKIRQDFATRLNCFRRTDTNRAYVIHQLAIRSDRKCNASTEEWFLPETFMHNINEASSGDKSLAETWDEFVKYRQCIYCEAEHKTTLLNPYCAKCLGFIREGCVSLDIIEISKELQGILRGELVWL